jgi:hypothetical protein
MQIQKRFHQIPRQRRHLGMVRRSRIAKKSVIRIRKIHIHKRLPVAIAFIRNRLRLLLADVLILPAPAE